MGFYNDRPLVDPKDDVYGLAPFSRRVARIIRMAQVHENMVIGLSGGWGTGKTTAINFSLAYLMASEKAGIPVESKDEGVENQALDSLRSSIGVVDKFSDLEKHHGSGENETVIIRYNPWLVSGHETLISDYFRILGEKAAEFALDEQSKKKIRRYSRSVARFLGRAAGAGETVIEYLAIAAAASDPTGGTSSLLQAKASPFNWLRRRMKALTAKLDEVDEPTTLADAREKLQELLKKINKRFLVVIDDIDRLEIDEIKPMISMVKSVGDLPNVTYFLGYDRRLINDVLSECSSSLEFPTFMEKIVQTEFEIPKLATNGLVNDLLAWLPTIKARKLTAEEQFDIQQDFYVGSRMLENPRDLVKLKNALARLHVAIGSEVLVTDLIRLEMIRIKEPAVFAWIMKHWAIFAGQHNLVTDYTDEEGKKAFWDTAFEGASGFRKEVCKEWLCRTFPGFQDDFPNTFVEPRANDPYLGFPLSRPEGWLGYLLMYPHADTLPIEKWEYINQHKDNASECMRICSELAMVPRSDDRPMLQSIVDDLPRFITPDHHNPSGLLQALLESSEDIWWGNNYGMSFARAVALMHLVEMVPRQERAALFKEIVSSPTAPIGSVSIFVSVLSHGHDYLWPRQGQEEEPFIEVSDLAELVTIVAEKASKMPRASLGWSLRIGTIVRMLERGLGESATKKILEEVLVSGNRSVVGVIYNLSTLVFSSGGKGFEFRHFSETNLYNFPHIYELAQGAIEDEGIADHRPVLLAFVEGWEQYLVRSQTSP